MNTAIYNQVLELSVDLANASTSESTREYWDYYAQLRALCFEYKDTEFDHPLQWEALADFTKDTGVAYEFYLCALSLAKELKLNEYCVTIHIALAEQYQAAHEFELANEYANYALEIAQEDKDKDEELIQEINELLVELSKVKLAKYPSQS